MFNFAVLAVLWWVALGSISGENLAVPSLEGAPTDTFSQIGIDKFFSLWNIYVEVNNVTDQPWTLFVPLNEGLPEDSAFVADEDFTRRTLLNHLVVGEAVDIDEAESRGNHFYSHSDSVLIFTKGRGQRFVNGIPLTGDKITFGKGVVYVIEKSIPLSEPEFIQFIPFAGLSPLDSGDTGKPTKENTEIIAEALEPLAEQPKQDGVNFEEKIQELNFEESESKDFLSTTKSILPRRNDSNRGFFNLFSTTAKSIEETLEINEENSSRLINKEKPLIFDSLLPLKEELKSIIPQSKLEETTTSNSDSEIDSPVEEFSEFLIDDADSAHSTFVSSMLSALDTSSSNGREFAHHFKKANLDRYLSADKNYTGIIGTNRAFYDYYPIDWGFNPFLVDNFTRDVLLNHILEGDVDLQSFDDHVEVQTIEGKTIKVSKDREGTLLVNGNIVPKETEVQVPHGRLYFIHKLLFVDYDRVFELRREYPFLETAPLLSFPWPSAPFLSHLLNKLHENQRTKLFTRLLENSHITNNVSSNDENFNRISYTAFVPIDDGALKVNETVLDGVDQKTSDEFLLNHIVEGYLFEKNFTDELTLRSLTGKLIPVKKIGGDIFIGSSKIVQPQKFIYNLGTIFLIDSPLFDLDVQERTNASTNQGTSSLLIDLIPFSSSTIGSRQSTKRSKLSEQLTESSSPPIVLSPTKKFERSVYAVRTETSYSRQIGDGPNVPITKEEMERELRL